jgi:hypothetical protein
MNRHQSGHFKPNSHRRNIRASGSYEITVSLPCDYLCQRPVTPYANCRVQRGSAGRPTAPSALSYRWDSEVGIATTSWPDP